MRFFANDPFHLVKATWYRCKPGAKVFPTWHTFTSENWDYSHPTFFPLGDDAFSKRVWYNGRRLNSSDGTTFAGPLEFFQTGAPAPGLLPRSTDGTPVVCLLPPFGKIKGGLCVPVSSGRGGKRKGGFVRQAITPGLPCGNCVGTTPSTCTVTGAGFPAPNAVFNGTFQLNQDLVFPGYLALAGAWAGAPVRKQDGSWEDGGVGPLQFKATAPPPAPQIVYGWYAANAAGTVLIGSGKFATPFTFTLNGDGFDLELKMNLLQNADGNYVLTLDMEQE